MKKIFTIVGLVSCFYIASSQSPITFKAFDGLLGIGVVKPYFDSAFAGITIDTAVLTNIYNGHYVLFKIDLQGNIISSKRFLSTNQNEKIAIVDFVVNSDSSITLAGEINYKNNSLSIDYDFLTIKVDKFDSIVFCKTIRDTSINRHNNHCNRIVSIHDGGWLILGGSLPDAPGFYPTSTVIKIDSLGNRVWSYLYGVGGSSDVLSSDAIELSNGDILILATYVYPPNTYFGILKLSSTGNVLLARDFRIPTSPDKIISLVDSNLYCLVGSALYSININGSINWNKNFGIINDAIQMSDGVFYMAGTRTIYNDNFTFSNPNYFLSRLDSGGNTLWAKNYGRCQQEGGYKITASNNQVFVWGGVERKQNDGYALTGYLCTDTNGTAPCQYNDDTLNYTVDVQPTPSNVTVTKTSWFSTQDYPILFQSYQIQTEDVCSMQDSCITWWGIDETSGIQKYSVYPNPFSQQIIFGLSTNEQTTVSLYDFLGQQVLQQTFTNTATIITEQLANGIYFYELRNSKGTLKAGKVVKQ